MRRILLIATAAALATLALAACKSSDGDGIATVQGTATPSPTASFQPDPAAFAKCMRDHHVNIPDPVPGQEWRPDKPREVTREQFEAAVRTCQSFLGENLLGQPPSPQEMEKLRAFAVCMREHGIEMTDPLPDGNMKINGRLGQLNRTQLNADPQFRAAEDACKHLLPVDDGKKK
ncbi:MAG: hypothetical protein HOV78_29875 [Hamadaea sp.]|nr:hypothetical protein [Hamadaea sp.]